MTIEVEKRGLITKQQYEGLRSIIVSCGGVELGENHTRTDFYLAEDAQAKVQHAVSKEFAKIAWKSGGNNGTSARQEIEVRIEPQDLAAARTLLDKLMTNARHFSTSQQRHDFRLDNVHIAVKHSEDWGYHIELEVMIDDRSELPAAEASINRVAELLGVKLLTEQEEKEFVEKKIAERNG